MKPTTSKAYISGEVKAALANPETREKVLRGVFSASVEGESDGVTLDGRRVVFRTKPSSSRVVRVRSTAR